MTCYKEKKMGTKQDQVINVDEWLEWGDSYDGDLPELDLEDYDDYDAMEAADEERRCQYWRLTGTVATSRAAWEHELRGMGAEPGSEYWLAAEKIVDRFRNLIDNYWPVDCHLAYERGDGYTDEMDSIDGAGHYSILDL